MSIDNKTCAAILRSGNSMNRSNPLYINQVNLIPYTGSMPLASVTIDTTPLCLSNIEIEFYANFDILVSGSITANLSLSKIYKNGQIIQLKNFTIRKLPPTGTKLENIGTLNFIFCDKNQPPGCYTYVVELTSSTFSTALDLFNITGTEITALAVGYPVL